MSQLYTAQKIYMCGNICVCVWIKTHFIVFLVSCDFCREGLEVTDDVSIVEHLKHPVYITEGSYTNIKVTAISLEQ